MPNRHKKTEGVPHAPVPAAPARKAVRATALPRRRKEPPNGRLTPDDDGVSVSDYAETEFEPATLFRDGDLESRDEPLHTR